MRKTLPILLSLLILAAAPVARAAEHVDVLLVLAADVSRSISTEKFDLQRKGYAAALTDPDVIEAIGAGPNRRIAVAFVEWSGDSSQEVVVDWSIIGTRTEAEAFGTRVLNAPRTFANRTAIGSAITYAGEVLARCPFTAERRVIDLSGDGISNSGDDVHRARDTALAHGVSAINGLVILSASSDSSYMQDHTHPPGGLQNYYRQNVIGGQGSFVLVAESFESFGRSLVAKLIQEIS